MPPRLLTACSALPPEGAAAPACEDFARGIALAVFEKNYANFPSSNITSVRLTSASAVDITTLAVISSSATL